MAIIPVEAFWLRQKGPWPATELQVHVPTTYQQLRPGQLPLRKTQARKRGHTLPFQVPKPPVMDDASPTQP
jgi:hypothetical protein